MLIPRNEIGCGIFRVENKSGIVKDVYVMINLLLLQQLLSDCRWQ